MKRYFIESQDIDYVINCKLKLAAIIKDRGWTIDALSASTGVPATTIYGWLNLDSPFFPPLQALSLICRHLEVTVNDVLADPMWNSIDHERFLFVRPWMSEPIERVKLVTDFYYKLKESFKEE